MNKYVPRLIVAGAVVGTVGFFLGKEKTSTPTPPTAPPLVTYSRNGRPIHYGGAPPSGGGIWIPDPPKNLPIGIEENEK